MTVGVGKSRAEGKDPDLGSRMVLVRRVHPENVPEGRNE